MAKYSALDLAYDILKNAQRPLLYQEIWSLAKETELPKKVGFTGKTPWNTIGARLFVDVRDNQESRFIKVGKNPARFFLKERQEELTDDLINQIEKEESTESKKSTKEKYNERDLHPIFSYFAYTNSDFNKGKAIYTKTIYHEKSSKTGMSEWIHPDIIGFYSPIEDWNEKILNFNDISDSNSIVLYSFELKKKIDKSNYRECFFQAVSNSSWANEGYLVTASIKQDDDLFSELERLSNSFGIGLIHLDLEDIDASSVIFNARFNNNLDWELMNKLCEKNNDFADFIDNITKDYKSLRISRSLYDDIPAEPEILIKKML